jgi:diguanylate cyclase (GGDEF)-like protein
MQRSATIGDLARPALVVRAGDSCEQVDVIFRTRPRLPSVVVTDGSRTGLVMRTGFGHTMSGPFGYGRALLADHQISELADWAPLRLPADASVAHASQRLRSRPLEHRYDDVLVDYEDGRLGRVSAARLFDALARQFAHHAIRDELTGLINRSHFLDQLAAACARAQTTGDRVALAVVDLDGLKRINDRYGHENGDTVLTLTAQQLTEASKPGDLVARLGGDEFAILSRLPAAGPTQAQAEAIGDRCRRALRGRTGRTGPDLRMRGSVGIAVSGTVADPQTLLREADMALYRAKLAGGDETVCTIGVGAGLAEGAARGARSVRDALRHGELRLLYQPIVNLNDGSVASIEALVRWQHPSLGLLAPDRFLPGARRDGQLPALDAWVLGQACADLRVLLDLPGGQQLRQINVNISPATLATPFDELVQQVLRDTGLPAWRLCLELPEDADLETLTGAAARLDRLHQLGVGLTLDDMGAGSTSLRHLSTLNIQGMKIDQTFVAGMLHNPRDHTVVKLLADLAHGLHLNLTAEGVETVEQLVALTELGVHTAQGYHLGRPEPLEAMLASLTEAATLAGQSLLP